MNNRFIFSAIFFICLLAAQKTPCLFKAGDEWAKSLVFKPRLLSRGALLFPHIFYAGKSGTCNYCGKYVTNFKRHIFKADERKHRRQGRNCAGEKIVPRIEQSSDRNEKKRRRLSLRLKLPSPQKNTVEQLPLLQWTSPTKQLPQYRLKVDPWYALLAIAGQEYAATKRHSFQVAKSANR